MAEARKAVGARAEVPLVKGKSEFDVLDGRKIRELVGNEELLRATLEGAFKELDKDNSGTLSRAELRPAFLHLSSLLGFPPPGTSEQLDKLVDVIFQRQGQGQQGEVAPAGAGAGPDLALSDFIHIMQQVLSDVASMLQEDPLFLAVFNGVVLRELAEDEDALKSVISKAFEQLDKDKSGKLSRSELLPVLKLLSGGDAPLPPPQLLEKMEEALLAQFGSGGEEELSREEFTALFKDLVLFMATVLQEKPVLIVQEATVLNGFSLRKLVEDEVAFAKEAGEMFEQWDRSKRGKLSKGDVAEGLKRLGMAIGLPPANAKEAEQLYAELFSVADFDENGYVDRGEFEALLKALLLSLSSQLEQRPVVVNCAVRGLDTLPSFRLLDGTDVFEALNDESRINGILNDRFDVLDENKNGVLSKTELKPALLRLAQLLGLPAPGTQEQMDVLLDELYLAVVGEDFNEEVDRERFIAVSKEILRGIANSLEADPMVSVVLDGSRLTALMADTPAFQQVSNNVFDTLDTDGNGHLSMSELKTALQQLGLQLGVPPAGVRAEGDAVVEAAVAEYGQGKKELSRADFSNLLRDVLTDIATRLATNPVVVGQSVKVLNGSRIRKLLGSSQEFTSLVEELFSEWDCSRTGRLSKADLTAGMKKLGVTLGLPPPRARDAERVYSQLFINADMDDSGFVDRKEFHDFMRLVFVDIASELEKNPVVVEATLVSYS